MFYSKDLLGKKSSLGSVWMAAHHKKINKGTIMQINVGDTCNKIMDPEVPQALRLQAILATGVVIIHTKQATFLFEDCTHALQHVTNTMAHAPAANLDGQVAETADITLVDDDSLMGMTELFPNYPAQLQLDAAAPGGLSLSRQVSEDLFLMPSLPSNINLTATVSDGGKEPSGGYDPMQQQHYYMDEPETFEVPEFEMAQFYNNDYFPPPMNTPDDQAPVNGDMEFPPPDEEAIKPAPVKKRRTKKAQLDDLQTIQASQARIYMALIYTYAAQDAVHRNNVDRRALLRRRPMVTNTFKPTIFPGPASFNLDRVHPMFADMWNALVKVPEAVPAAGKKRRAKSPVFDPDAVTPQAGYDGWGMEAEMPPPMEIGGWEPMPEDFPGAGYEGWHTTDNGGAMQHGDLEKVDIELERLRMALNGGTPSQNRDFLQYQLGATPASDGLRPGSKRGRNSDVRSDSEGSYSERSTDPREGRRLSDLLQGALGDLDAGNLLPPLGEDEPFLDGGHDVDVGGMRKRLRSGSLVGKPFSLTNEPLSQFQLIEESAPNGLLSLPSLPSHLGRQTESVFNYLQSLLVDKEGQLSLLEVSSKLGRLEATRLFYQILVCRSFGLVDAEQEEPMGDITITAPMMTQGM